MINTTGEDQAVRIPDLAELLGKPLKAWQDLTPDTIPLKLKGDLSFTLAPARMRLFYNPEGRRCRTVESQQLSRALLALR